MNLFFNTSPEDTSLSKVAISHDISNIQDHHSPDYFHYIDFTLPIFLNKIISQLIDKKLLLCISLYHCNTIIADGLFHQTSNKISKRRMILKFLTLSDLLQFATNIKLPIRINSIRCIHNSLFSDPEDSGSDPGCSDPDCADDSDCSETASNCSDPESNCADDSYSNCADDSDDDVDEDDSSTFYKIFDVAEDSESSLSHNNLPIFLSGKNPAVSLIDDDGLNCLLQKIVQMQIGIDGDEQNVGQSQLYFADLYSKHIQFSKFKQSYLDHVRKLTYENKIIKVKKPKIHASLYDQYTIISSLGCGAGLVDSDDESTTDSELDISELSDDNWKLDKLSYNSNTILSWLENEKNIKSYALSFDGDAILYFNDIEKAEKYIKYISAMLIEKFKVLHFPNNFRLTKIDNGYQIDKCIWNILIPIYIKYSKIILVPIFEIN